MSSVISLYSTITLLILWYNSYSIYVQVPIASTYKLANVVTASYIIDMQYKIELLHYTCYIDVLLYTVFTCF